LAREVINNFAFALVAPLQAEDDVYLHVWRKLVIAGIGA
jgi:hypothetical protein